jgi:hypothetical protein
VSCRIKRMQGVIKSATTGSTSELLRCRGIAHRARPGPPGPPLKPRLEICTERLDPSPSRLRLIVVYAEQPPAASSINAADACSAGPSGVGLGRRAGTVASARTELGRPEERHAERACAADASTLPPSSAEKVKLYTGALTRAQLEPFPSKQGLLFREPDLGGWQRVPESCSKQPIY